MTTLTNRIAFVFCANGDEHRSLENGSSQSLLLNQGYEAWNEKMTVVEAEKDHQKYEVEVCNQNFPLDQRGSEN